MKKSTYSKNYLTVLLHFGSWALVCLWPLFEAQDTQHINRILMRSSLPTLFMATIFYINYFYLIDYFFLKKRRTSFIVFNLLIIIIFMFVMNYFFLNIKNDFLKIFNVITEVFGRRRYFMHIQFAITLVLSVGMSLGIKMSANWNKIELEIEKAKRTQLSTANKYLRYQIQPHFLFNTLNSIYSLASKKSNDAPEVILTLSDLMRYMLYKTDGELVLLKEEIEYIKNYIKLQRLRIMSNENIKINVHGTITSQKISPFIFISFIENAFKYGTDFKGNTEIKIGVHVDENQLQFSCVNLIGNRSAGEHNSGIGLSNTRQRLKLLYPEAHQLVVKEEKDRFIVNLKLKLTT